MREQLNQLWRKARDTDGAVDLASIMVGILVLGVAAGIIAATVFGVIPWTQNNAAQQSLHSIRQAEAIAMVKEQPIGQYWTTQELVDKGYLPQGAVSVVAAGLDIRAGRGASVSAAAAAPVDPAPNKAVVATNAARSCYVAAIKSSTGDVFYTTNTSPDIKAAGGVTPDTSSCVTFPLVVKAADATPPPPELADATFGKNMRADLLYQVDKDQSWNTLNQVSGTISATCDQGATWASTKLEVSADGVNWISGTGGTKTNPLFNINDTALSTLDANTSGISFRVSVTCTKSGFADKVSTYAGFPSMAFKKANLGTVPTVALSTSGHTITWSQTSGAATTCAQGSNGFGDYKWVRYQYGSSPSETAWVNAKATAGTLYSFQDDSNPSWQDGDVFKFGLDRKCSASAASADGNNNNSGVAYRLLKQYDSYTKAPIPLPIAIDLSQTTGTGSDITFTAVTGSEDPAPLVTAPNAPILKWMTDHGTQYVWSLDSATITVGGTTYTATDGMLYATADQGKWVTRFTIEVTGLPDEVTPDMLAGGVLTFTSNGTTNTFALN